MASPEWFFSTIAQAAAAIVGFVIAFSAIIYQMERRRREQRTEELREHLSDLHSKYMDVIAVMASGFGMRVDLHLESLGPSDPRYRDAGPDDYPGEHRGLEARAAMQGYLDTPLETDAQEFEARFDEWEEADKSMTFVTHLHLLRVNELLGRMGPSEDITSHYLLSTDEFEKLGESVGALADIFGLRNLGRGQQLYNELRGASDESAYGAFYSKKAFGGPVEEDVAVDEVTDWLLEYVRPEIADHLNTLKRHLRLEDETEEDDDGRPFTADSIAMWSLVFDELASDFEDADIQRYNTILDPPPRMNRILTVSGLLLFIGVFVPLIFLLTVPDTVPLLRFAGRGLLVFQFAVLSVVGILSVYLLNIVARNLYP